jgi:rod shape-determining protein MreC
LEALVVVVALPFIHVLVLEPMAAQLPARPEPEAAEKAERPERQLKTPRRAASTP